MLKWYLTNNSTLLLLDGASCRQGYIPNTDGDFDNSSLISLESASALETLSRLACPFFTICLKDAAVLNSVSIFLIHSTYQATSTLIRVSNGNPDMVSREHIASMKMHLDDLSHRWRVAGMFENSIELIDLVLNHIQGYTEVF